VSSGPAPAQVETYYGLQLVRPVAAAPPAAPVVVPVVTVPSSPPVVSRGTGTCGSEGCTGVRQLSHSEPAETPPPALAPTLSPAAPLPLRPMPAAQETPLTAPPAPVSAEAARPEERHTPTTLVIHSPAPGETPAATREAHESSTAGVLHDITLLHALIAVAAFVVGPLVAVLAVLFLLRRYTSRNGPLFRIEFVSNGQGFTLVGPGAGGAVESHRVVVPPPTALAPDGAEPPGTAQRFDIGPTYAEELQLREQAGKQQEEATLRHIFEENLKLLHQIEEAPDAEGEAPSESPVVEDSTETP
jgi:hypothetical protein